MPQDLEMSDVNAGRNQIQITKKKKFIIKMQNIPLSRYNFCRKYKKNALKTSTTMIYDSQERLNSIDERN